MSGSLGFALGPAAGGRLVDAGVLSLRGLYFLDSALSVGTTLLVLLAYREARSPRIASGSAGRQALDALLSPVAGLLGDRFGFARVLAAAAGAVAVSLAVFPFVPTVAALVGVAVLFGAGRSAAQAMLFALLATRTPAERRATTLNLVYVPLYVGGIIGPAIAAAIVGAGLAPVVFVGAGAFVLALVLTLRGVRPTPSPTPSSASAGS